MAWYYKDGDQEIGPVEKEELQDLVKAKRIDRQTLVRSSAMNEWKPLAEFARKKQRAEDAQPAEEDIAETDAQPPDETPSEAAGETEPPEELPSSAEADAESTEESPAPSTDTTSCSQCGRSFSRNEVVTFDNQVICADCKPAFVQKLKEGASPGGDFRYAGFWIRFGAKIIDGIIFYAVNFALSMLLGILFVASGMSITPEEAVIPKGYWLMVGIQQLVSIAIPTAYNTYFIGRFGATLGKMACGLRVITPSGGRVSYPRALGRNFAEWISSLILSIGYIMAAFDSEKRALHDRICNTRVIYKK